MNISTLANPGHANPHVAPHPPPFDATRSNSVTCIYIIGIVPDGGYYSIGSISQAIKAATGYTPGIQCNVDEARNSQLYEIYLCVDTSGSELIQCPKLPRGRCSSNRIEFPAF